MKGGPGAEAAPPPGPSALSPTGASGPPTWTVAAVTPTLTSFQAFLPRHVGSGPGSPPGSLATSALTDSCGARGRSMGFGARSLGFGPQLHHLLVVRPWALSALFSHHKTELIMTVSSAGGRGGGIPCGVRRTRSVSVSRENSHQHPSFPICRMTDHSGVLRQGPWPRPRPGVESGRLNFRRWRIWELPAPGCRCPVRAETTGCAASKMPPAPTHRGVGGDV